MGRELQKKKRRSKLPKIKHKPKSKHVNNPRGNAIIAANWNQQETLSQNYRRLGLTSRLNTATGGIEKIPTPSTPYIRNTASDARKKDKLSILNATPKILEPSEARVERDPETGKIVRVIHSKTGEARRRMGPLRDLLNSEDSDVEFDGLEDVDGISRDAEGEEGRGGRGRRGIIEQLEDQASREAPKKERGQSEREREWIARLVERWGADYAKMARDRKLNPMQQTEADIKRRVGAWKQRSDGEADVGAEID